MGFVGFGGAFHKTRPPRHEFDQTKLRRVGQALQPGLGQGLGAQGAGIEYLGGVAHHRAHPGVGVLHVKNGVVPGLLGHPDKIEIQRLVVGPRQHDEAHHVLAHRVDDVAQGDEGPRPFRHLHRPAVVQQVDQTADLDVQGAGAFGHRLDRRLHALDVAPVVGAPDVDHGLETAPELVQVIGDVGGEVGPRAVRFLQRPVDVVAEPGGAEQHLGPGLPVVRGLALRRLEDAGVNQVPVLQEAQRVVDLAAGHQGALGGENVEADAERLQVALDQVHHGADGERADRGQPLVRRRRAKLRPIFPGQCLAHRNKILARIFYGTIPADILAHLVGHPVAEGLEVPPAGGKRQFVHLGAGVVDVVFAGHPVARLPEQRRQGVADHGAAPVADVERPRRVGGDELHVDGLAAAHRRIAVGRAGPQNLGQPGVPECVL